MEKLRNYQVFNVIRAEASYNFQSRINKATKETFSNLANDIFTNSSYTEEYNEFLKTMINKIAFTIFREKKIKNIYSKYIYYNKPLGQVIEEVTVTPAVAMDYDKGYNETTGNYDGVDQNKVTLPKIIANYYSNTASRKYRVTVYDDQIAKAVTTEYGLSSLIGMIVNSLYKGATNDEYLLFKEVLGAFITTDIKGTPKQPSQVLYTMNELNTPETVTGFINLVKNTLSEMMLPTPKFNAQQILQQQELSDCTLFVKQKLLNYIQTDVLASAFNKGDLNFNPAGATSTVKVRGIDEFGAMGIWFNKNNFGGQYDPQMYKVRAKYLDNGQIDPDINKWEAYNLPENQNNWSILNNAKPEEIYFIPTYRMVEEVDSSNMSNKYFVPKYDIACLIMDDTLPVIAIERENFGTFENLEGLYYNSFLIRKRSYAWTPTANGVVVYYNDTSYNHQQDLQNGYSLSEEQMKMASQVPKPKKSKKSE